jgi:hypothetical protein
LLHLKRYSLGSVHRSVVTTVRKGVCPGCVWSSRGLGTSVCVLAVTARAVGSRRRRRRRAPVATILRFLHFVHCISFLCLSFTALSAAVALWLCHRQRPSLLCVQGRPVYRTPAPTRDTVSALGGTRETAGAWSPEPWKGPVPCSALSQCFILNLLKRSIFHFDF